LTEQDESAGESHHSILLYDGVCGLCNRLVQFVLRHDRDGIFQFASLQSAFSARILTRHGANPTDLDTFYVVLYDDQLTEQLLPRSDAVIWVLKRLGGLWQITAFFIGILPRVVRDWVYDVIARNRYRMFGRYKTCPLPSAETRARFIDL
jgi:predicted DCC family thiol-disulfide oxidoreductase YuxK